jgi:hypothetical protein
VGLRKTVDPFGNTFSTSMNAIGATHPDHHWNQLSWSPVAFVYEERPKKLDNYTYKEMNNVRLP